MDKKNTIIGVLLLCAAFASLYLGRMFSPAPPPPAPDFGGQTAPLPGTGTAPAGAPATGAASANVAAPQTAFAPLATGHQDATITVLQNELIEARFSDYGGALLEVAFKHYPATYGSSDPFVFNQSRVEPMLAITNVPGLGADTRYTLVSSSATEVVYRATLEGRLEVTRRYSIQPTDDGSARPYQIRHETTVRNLAGSGAPQTISALALGTTALLSSTDVGQYISLATYDGDDTEYVDRRDLEGGGVLSWVGLSDGAPKPFISTDSTVVWAAMTSQFFTSIYTSDEPGIGTSVRRVELSPFPGSSRPNHGLSGTARYLLPALDAGASATLAGDLYVGPKEYRRLRNLEHGESKVMQFDHYFFNRIFLSPLIAPLMNLLMNATHSWVGNWGWAIVLMTLLLKLVTLPFTLAASRSAKRMAKLQPQMKELREKYKDNPQKMNQATIALFKEHRVNPMGGCIPVLITIPLFIAFFAMLQGTAELRFQGFLWARDLSAPDTIARVFGIPINIMPLLMGATMLIQMRLTPTPTTDPVQASIFKFMPVVFTFFCYSFAAALALYSTVNGIFTIVQQLVVNKVTKDPAPVSPGATATAAGSTLARGSKSGKGRKRR